MKSDYGARTYGVKLKPPRTMEQVQFPVTKRICDIEHYERTGEVKYIDEEVEIMLNMDARENAKKMRKEITTLAQFNGIGNYREVGLKYHVSMSTAHAHKLHLVNLEKEANEMIQGPSMEQIEQFHTDTEIQPLPKVEFGDNPDLSLANQNEAQNELNGQGTCDCAKEGKQEECGLNMDEYNESPRETLERFIDTAEEPDPIESMWKVVEGDLEIIHKLYVEQAEKEFSTRSSLVLRGVSA